MFDGKDPAWVAKTVPLTPRRGTTSGAPPPAPRARAPTTRSGPRVRRAPPTRSTPHPQPARPVRPRTRPHPGRRVARLRAGRRVRLGRRRRSRAIALDHTVVYEAHVKGITKLNPDVPEELRGTYAGLAHPSTIALPQGPRRHDGRAAAGAPVRERAAPRQDGPRQLLGLQHPQLLHPARRLRDPRPPSSAAPARCCASSRGWCGCCTRPASR